MLTKDLIGLISKSSGLSKKEAEQFIQQILFDRYGECEIKMRLQEFKTPLMSLIER